MDQQRSICGRQFCRATWISVRQSLCSSESTQALAKVSMQHVQLRPASFCGGPPRMHRHQTRKAFTCTRCQQQQHDNGEKRQNVQQVMLDIGQKMAVIAAASLLTVKQHALTSWNKLLRSSCCAICSPYAAQAAPASALSKKLFSSSRKTEAEFEEILKSRGGFPQVNSLV